MTCLNYMIHVYIHTYIHTYIYTYIPLHTSTLHYNTLHCITLHYIKLHYITYIYIYISSEHMKSTCCHLCDFDMTIDCNKNGSVHGNHGPNHNHHLPTPSDHSRSSQMPQVSRWRDWLSWTGRWWQGGHETFNTHIYIYIYVDIIRYQVIFNMHHTIYTNHTDYLRYLDYVYNYIILQYVMYMFGDPSQLCCEWLK